MDFHKDKDKNEIKDKSREKNGEKRESNIDIALKSIQINIIFWLITFFCLLIINRRSGKYTYTETIITFIIVMIWGYYVHVISHAYDFEKLYTESDNFITNFLKQDENLDPVVLFFLRQLDFHSKIHHDSTINKLPYNLFMECFQNIISQSSLIIFSGISLFGLNINFDKNAIFFWALFYVTVHNINYNFVNQQFHIDHHINEKTNYGIDILDIIFDSKSDLSFIENNNYYIINSILITLFIINTKLYY